MHRYMENYSTYKICNYLYNVVHMRRLLDGSTHCAGGYSTGSPVSGPENIFWEHMEKNELKEPSECTFSFR